MDWISLDKPEQLGQIDEKSSGQDAPGIVLFKHSTRCSISSMAKSRFERGWNTGNSAIPVFLLDLIAHRDISNEIASRYGIRHESPQVLVIKNGKCIYHASHTEIDADAVAEAAQSS